jgi:peptide deformylase
MAILKILEFPDPCLRAVAKPVTVFDEALRELVRDMAETMYDAPGVGLLQSAIGDCRYLRKSRSAGCFH